MALFRTGSWGTPEFGITEFLSDLLGKPRNPQGGSELLGRSESPPKNIEKKINEKKQPPTFKTQTTSTQSLFSQPQRQLQPQSQPQGLIPITEEEALARGLDINNLPAGYYAYRPVDYTKRIREGISGAYNEVISTLDEIANLIPQRRAQEEQRLKEFLQTQTEALGTQKQSSLANLDVAGQQVKQEGERAKEDVYSSLRNLLQSATQKLGLAGAGASSAQEVMLPFALGKQAARSLSQVQSEVLKQLNQIEMKKNDVNSTYDLAINQLNQDYQQQMGDLIARYNNYLDQIRIQKANASQQKQLALAQLEEGLMQQARADAQALRDTLLQRQFVIEDWKRNRLATLNNYMIELQGFGQYTPQQILASELQGLQGEMSPSFTSQGDLASIISAMTARKKLLEDLGQNF